LRWRKKHSFGDGSHHARVWVCPLWGVCSALTSTAGTQKTQQTTRQGGNTPYATRVPRRRLKYSHPHEEYCTPLDRRGGTNPPPMRSPQESRETEGWILAGQGRKDQRTHHHLPSVYVPSVTCLSLTHASVCSLGCVFCFLTSTAGTQKTQQTTPGGGGTPLTPPGSREGL
jgi:hypothetical protein